MTDVIITDDKKFMRKLIFDGTEDEAIKLCRIIKNYSIYDGFAGFGQYIYDARVDDKKAARELADKLTKAFNGQKNETHRVWIVLQAVMKWMAGEATDEFKEKVDN